MTVEGWLPGTLVYQGSITAEIFIAWMRYQVLPQLPASSILVMNNASIHCNQAFKDMVTEAGMRLEYLPPYSPDFNLIEEAFATLKAWIKRNASLASDFSNFGAFVQYAVEVAGGRSARAQFAHTGYM